MKKYVVARDMESSFYEDKMVYDNIMDARVMLARLRDDVFWKEKKIEFHLYSITGRIVEEKTREIKEKRIKSKKAHA